MLEVADVDDGERRTAGGMIASLFGADSLTSYMSKDTSRLKANTAHTGGISIPCDAGLDVPSSRRLKLNLLGGIIAFGSSTSGGIFK